MKRVLTVLLLLSLFLTACGGKLDENDAYALDILKSYREMLVDPDSMKLYGDVTIIHALDHEDTERVYCFFTAGGTNAQGKELTSAICYLDGAFFCDMEDLETYLENGMGATDTVMDISLLMRGQDVLEKYRNRESYDATNIDGAGIAKQMKIQWEASHD